MRPFGGVTVHFGDEAQPVTPNFKNTAKARRHCYLDVYHFYFSNACIQKAARSIPSLDLHTHYTRKQ